ncbi:unnamed protein product [Tilletia controversa]|nr:unnamed protein product [Tilletia controversa]
MPRSGYRYYAVAAGYETGVFNYWCEAKNATDGYPRARFQGFNNLAEAWEYVARGGAYSKRAWSEIRTTPESYGPYQKSYNYYAVAGYSATGQLQH